MRKSFLLALSLGSALFLAACNNDDNAQNGNTPAGDVKNGVNDVMDDTRDVIDDTVDTVDPNARNGQTNESTMDNNTNVPNGSSGPNGDNGVTAPGAPSVNQEGIIEDQKDRNDKDKIDNR